MKNPKKEATEVTATGMYRAYWPRPMELVVDMGVLAVKIKYFLSEFWITRICVCREGLFVVGVVDKKRLDLFGAIDLKVVPYVRMSTSKRGVLDPFPGALRDCASGGAESRWTGMSMHFKV